VAPVTTTETEENLFLSEEPNGKKRHGKGNSTFWGANNKGTTN